MFYYIFDITGKCPDSTSCYDNIRVIEDRYEAIFIWKILGIRPRVMAV